MRRGHPPAQNICGVWTRSKRHQDTLKPFGWGAQTASTTMALRLGPVALRRGTHPVAELHAFHARDKRWPATLAELPAEVQACTFDPFSGKPFVYKLVDGEPLLYAVGLDQKDNGGVHDPSYGRREPNGDYVVWPLPGNM